MNHCSHGKNTVYFKHLFRHGHRQTKLLTRGLSGGLTAAVVTSRGGGGRGGRGGRGDVGMAGRGTGLDV